jgi:hypothetical protein
MTQAKENQMMMYKGKPLVRSGNTIYYGSMADRYVTLLQVLSTNEFHGIQMASKVSVQLLSTDPNHGPKERIVKKTEKNGLYNALNIANIWLMRYLEQ